MRFKCLCGTKEICSICRGSGGGNNDPCDECGGEGWIEAYCQLHEDPDSLPGGHDWKRDKYLDSRPIQRQGGVMKEEIGSCCMLSTLVRSDRLIEHDKNCPKFHGVTDATGLTVAEKIALIKQSPDFPAPPKEKP